jgi:hypothetical protein
MAYLLTLSIEHGKVDWQRHELPAGPIQLHFGQDGLALEPLPPGFPASVSSRQAAVIMPWQVENQPLGHVLLMPDGQAYINGEPASAGLACLSDHDHVLLGKRAVFGKRAAFRKRAAFFYDAFSRPRPSLYQEVPLPCAFCRDSIESGQAVVACPGCGVVYHHNETPDQSCWAAGERCRCGQLTCFDQSPDWQPAGFRKGQR